jgi:hypothetical protein
MKNGVLGRTALVITAVLLVAPALLACGGGAGTKPLYVEVASYELVANADNRFIAGLLTTDQDFVSYGSVKMGFSYLGQGRASKHRSSLLRPMPHFCPFPAAVPPRLHRSQ